MTQLDKNYEYYKKNHDVLLKKYANRFVIIKDENVVYSNKDFDKIIAYAKELEAGTYIIQEVTKNEESAIRVFHSRVRING